MFPAIFLDRDGVLIENRSDYIRELSQLKVIPEAIHALSLPALKNYRVVIVTNQSAIGRGLISVEAAQAINNELVGLVQAQGGRIHGVYMCPHRPEAGCSCRKPRPGLLLQAAEELSLDLARSWMIGDAWSDVQAGQAAGVRHAVLLKTGRGREQLSLPRPGDIQAHLILDNLEMALNAIFASDDIQALDASS